MTKTRRVFKKPPRHKQAFYFDANAEELNFPDIEAGKFPKKGDKIELEDDRKPTGKRLMPDGTVIKFKDGVVTSITDQDGKSMRRMWKPLLLKHGKNAFLVPSRKANEKIQLGDNVELNGSQMQTGTFDGPKGRKYTLMLGLLTKVTYPDGSFKQVKLKKTAR